LAARNFVVRTNPLGKELVRYCNLVPVCVVILYIIALIYRHVKVILYNCAYMSSIPVLCSINLQNRSS